MRLVARSFRADESGPDRHPALAAHHSGGHRHRRTHLYALRPPRRPKAAPGRSAARGIPPGPANIQNYAAREHFVFDHHWGNEFHRLLRLLQGHKAAWDRAVAYAHVPGGHRLRNFVLESGRERAAEVA